MAPRIAKHATTGANPREQVDELRQRIETLKSRISVVDEMVVPIERAHQRVDAMVDDLVEDGAIDGSVFAMSDYRRPRIGDDTDELLRLIAWIDPDTMKAKLRASVDEFYSGWDGALDKPETHAAASRDRAELYELEMEEERIISAAEALGMRLLRRVEADPRAVMQA